jgi:hypothetical protein
MNEEGEPQMSRSLSYGVMAISASLLAAVAVRAESDKRPPQRTVDACATAEVKKMSDYLGGLKAFTVRSHGSLTSSGGKATPQRETRGRVAMQRPNKLRVERMGNGERTEVYYDGESFTVFRPASMMYASAQAPPTVDELIDSVEEALGWIPPAADLLYQDPSTVLMSETRSGKCLESSTLDGVTVKHLSFDGPQVAWEIWIEQGNRPLPRKLVVLAKDDPNRERYTVELTDWVENPELSDSTFVFVPPQKAEKISFLAAPKSTPAQQGRKGKQP